MMNWLGTTRPAWLCLLGLGMLLPGFGIAPVAAGEEHVLVRDKQYLAPIGVSAEEWQEILQQIRPAQVKVDNAQRGGDLPGKDQRGVERSSGANGAIFQTDYLKAFNPGQSDQLGLSVALSDGVLVVGAPDEDSNGIGQDGNPSNNSLARSGAAYIFRRTVSGWVQEAYLKSPNPDISDSFGFDVAVSGDTVMISAPNESGSIGGINPAHNNSLNNSGAVYAYIYQNNNWVFQATLKASNPDPSDYFGQSVDISGETVVVGAYLEDGNGSGINPTVNNSSSNSGAVYIFQRTNNAWAQQAYLKASNTGNSDYFGYDVAISGNTVVVGAYFEDSPSSVINGTQVDNGSYNDSGAAYVFVRNGSSWSQQAYLKAPNVQASDYFGIAVDVSSDRIVIGAQFEDSNASGPNGNLFSDSATESGAAYVYERNASGSWYFRDYLKAGNTGNSDYFGRSVAISGDLVLVGAILEDGGASTVNGPDNNTASDSGAAYLYAVGNGETQLLAYVKAQNVGAADQFATALDISGGVLSIGASQEDSSTDHPNGPDNNNLPDAGAAYIFAGATNFHPLGGVVIGLAEGNDVLLRNSDGQLVRVAQNGSFRFPQQYTDGVTYAVNVEEVPQEPLQDCFISNAEGVFSGAAVNNILVDCSFRTLSIPRSLNTVDQGVIQVPVRFSPNGASIASLAFSIDYDESCVTPDADGDGELDGVAFSVPVAFSPYISFDPTDTDGEIDVSIADLSLPFTALLEGTVVTLDFTARCPATQGVARVDTDVHFSADPAPSFGDLAAQDVSGTLSEGLVRVWAGLEGDCNVSGGIAASDLNSVVFEIFDGDGDYYVDAPNSDFFGSPQGCDANGNETINAADITCTNLLIFGESCEPLRAPQGPTKPEINTRVDLEQDRVWLRVDLASQQYSVGAVAFSLVLDQTQFDLTQFDLNRDGVPDLINHPLGSSSLVSVNWHADGAQAIIEVLLADRANNELPEGLLLEIGIPTAQRPANGLSYAAFPVPSVSNNTGAELQAVFSQGDVILQDAFESP